MGIYLVYVAVALRALIELGDTSLQGVAAALLAMYGALLFSERWLTPALRSQSPRAFLAYRWIYLLLQSGLVLVLLELPPHLDFLPMLFIPLSLQAVLFFDKRGGFLWIAFFTLAMAEPLLAGWSWSPAGGLAMLLLQGGLCFAIGGYARLTQNARAVQARNRQLYVELQVAHRCLQDYAEEVEELAVAQERNRLARELHDSVTQTLFSMSLAAQSARMMLDKEPGRVIQQLDRLQELANSAVREIQASVAQLRPKPAMEGGLAAAVRRHLDACRSRDGLRVSLEVVSDAPLPEPATAGLHRIVQEALTNVAKHAGTREAIVRLDLAGNPPSVEVEDRGAGFEAGALAPAAGHMGIASMTERAREIGWRLVVDSQVGRGTRIRAEKPDLVSASASTSTSTPASEEGQGGADG